MKSLGLIALLVVVSSSVAQSRSTPYSIYFEGVLSDIGYDFEGLVSYERKKPPPVSTISCKGCVKITASQNSQSLRLLSDAAGGTATFPKKVVVHNCSPTGGGTGGGQVSFALNGINGAHFPAMNVAATEAAFFELEMETSGPAFAGYAATTKPEKDMTKSQKPWLPCNFRVSLGGLPTANVSQVSGFAIKNTYGDLDGDGAPDFAAVDPIRITFPVEDSALYREWFNSDDPAEEVKTLTIIYNDADGNPIIGAQFDVFLAGLGYTDLFLGPDATPGREVTAVVVPKGKIRIRSWVSVIE